MNTNQGTKLWKETLETIRVSVSAANFSTWLSKTHIVSVKPQAEDRQTIEIGCPSAFIADGVEKRYFWLIQDTLNQITGLKNDLVFAVHQVASNGQAKVPLFDREEKEDNLPDLLKKARIRPGFTFDNFAVSSSNSLAQAAADAVSKNLGKAYNPLFLWGGVGVGKTHLMLAIGHRILRENKGARVLYCMGEEFTTEIVEAIRAKDTQSFKKRYRSLDLLMLDDVQFIAGKNTVQEEFFHTFNTLLREGGQVVLTSDRPPSEIQKLEDRLRNRFEAGMIADIAPADFELLTAISLNKASERGINLPMEVAQLIASNIDNPRRIEGFLTRLISESQAQKSPITTELVNKLLGKTTTSDAFFTRKAVSPPEIIDAVASYYSIAKRKLLGTSRSRPIVYPRQVLMYILREEYKLPLQEVGRVVGGRDHTTIMHGVNKISQMLSTSDSLRNDVLGIKRAISG